MSDFEENFTKWVLLSTAIFLVGVAIYGLSYIPEIIPMLIFLALFFGVPPYIYTKYQQSKKGRVKCAES